MTDWAIDYDQYHYCCVLPKQYCWIACPGFSCKVSTRFQSFLPYQLFRVYTYSREVYYLGGSLHIYIYVYIFNFSFAVYILPLYVFIVLRLDCLFQVNAIKVAFARLTLSRSNFFFLLSTCWENYLHTLLLKILDKSYGHKSNWKWESRLSCEKRYCGAISKIGIAWHSIFVYGN